MHVVSELVLETLVAAISGPHVNIGAIHNIIIIFLAILPNLQFNGMYACTSLSFYK